MYTSTEREEEEGGMKGSDSEVMQNQKEDQNRNSVYRHKGVRSSEEC